MDPISDVGDVENARGTKSKAALVLVAGIVAGALIGAGVMAFWFRDAVVLTIPAPSTEALSYPDQKIPDIRTNIPLPKKLVSEGYYLLINKVVNELNQVGTNNNVALLPLMDAIKQKSTAQDFNGFFDLIIQARSEIKKNTDLLATIQEDIVAFKKINDTTTDDADIHAQTAVFLTSGDAFVQAFVGYFSILTETLSGPVPTQGLLDTLDERIRSLRTAGSVFQSELNALLTLIKQKDAISAP